MQSDESKRQPGDDDVFQPPEKEEVDGRSVQEEGEEKTTAQKVRSLVKGRVMGVVVTGVALVVGIVFILLYGWGGEETKKQKEKKIGVGPESAEEEVSNLEGSAGSEAEQVGDKEREIRGQDVGFGRAEKLQRRLEKRVDKQGDTGVAQKEADAGGGEPGPWDRAQENARQRRAQAYFQEEFQSDRAGVFKAGESMDLTEQGEAQGQSAGGVNSGESDQVTPSEMRERLASARERVASRAAQRAGQGGRRGGEQELEGFVEGEDGRNESTRSVERLREPVSEYVVQAGTMLPLVLETGIDSQLPGRIRGRFSRPVYDSVTGDHVLIPAGSTVVGEYNSEVKEGQSRAQVVWTRLLLPNGKSMKLGRMVGTSLSGKTGYKDKVDNQWGSVGAGVVLTSLLSAGAGAAGGTRNEFRREPRESALNAAGQNVSEQGQTIVERELDKEPIVKIRPGLEVSAFVHQDLVLEPYRGDDE